MEKCTFIKQISAYLMFFFLTVSIRWLNKCRYQSTLELKRHNGEEGIEAGK